MKPLMYLMTRTTVAPFFILVSNKMANDHYLDSMSQSINSTDRQLTNKSLSNSNFCDVVMITDHYERMLSISKRMSEYELGSTLYLHHTLGRDVFTEFYQTLSNILTRYDRSVSVFTANDKLLDELFVYSK